MKGNIALISLSLKVIALSNGTLYIKFSPASILSASLIIERRTFTFSRIMGSLSLLCSIRFKMTVSVCL